MVLGGAQLARDLFDMLARSSATPPGFTREAYGPGEQSAHDLVREQAERLGCRCEVDAAGNLYMQIAGDDEAAPPLFIGSHLDTVPHGGNYDGAAGVVAGLAVLANLAASGIKLQRGLTVMAIRAEEAAWFPLSYLGSKAALGVLPPDDLAAERSDTGRGLAWHMADAGFNPEQVERGEAHVQVEDVGAFVELHIEQGPVLLGEGCPVGIVSAMNGGFRYTQARCIGVHAHSGAEPRRSRHDAVLGFADLMARLESTWDEIEASGSACTITTGLLATDPAHHSASKVAGEVRFSLDFRSACAEVLDQLKVQLARHINEIATARGVTFALGTELTWPVVALDQTLQDQLLRAARDVNVRALTQSSGGGHDTATFAEAGIPSGMIFVRSANGSHNPDEHMEMEDFDQAVRVLGRFVENYCCG